jgi:hypothetical protein
MRRLTWIFAVVALSLAGCGGDDKPGSDAKITLPDKGKTDGPVTKQDGPVTKQDGPVTQQDTGGGSGGWGAKCSQTKACTDASAPYCAFVTASDGFCTKECTNKLQQCPGTVAGTYAACILPEPAPGTKSFCGFICQAKDSTGKLTSFPCPSELKCGDENPPGSGQKVCMP